MANKKLSAVIQIGGVVASSLGSAFGAVRRQTDSLGSSIQKLRDRQRELNSEIAKVGRDGNNAASLRVQYARQELDLIGKQITALKRRQAVEDARTANASRRSELGGKIGGTMATGSALLAPIGLAINEAANFDYQLQLIGNTADMTREQIGALKRAIMDTSKATGQSATNIQQGMGFLVAAGMDPAQATKFLQSIGKSATAAGADVEDLSKMVFTLNDSLKISPENMQAAIDSLAQAGKEGNVELRDMAKSMPVLGAGFVALKVEGREAAATMGAALQIARKGAADAGEASNNMANFLGKLFTDETAKKAAKLGGNIAKAIKDAQLKGENPIDAAMLEIIRITKGDQEKITKLFGDMQVQNFIRPMIQNWGEYQRIKEKALGADGVIERDFAKMMDTTKQKIMEVGQALGRLGVAMGSVFGGDAAGKSSGLAERIGQLTDFINANRDLVRVTVQVVGGLFVARLAILGLSYAWTAANGVWLAGRAAWMAAPAVFTAVGTALRFVGSGILWVGRALLMNPIGLAVTAIAGAVFLIYKYWDPLKGWFSALWEDIKSSFAAVYDWVVGKVAYMMELPGKIKAKVQQMFNGGGNDLAGTEYDANGIPTGHRLPDVPAMAAKGGTTVNDNSQTQVTIVQQPGQDGRKLFEEFEREQRRRRGVSNRGMMLDGVGAQ